MPLTSLERLRLGDWGGHPSRVISVEFRAKAVGTESNPDAPVYVKTVGIVASSAEVDVELTLPAGAYTVQAKASHWLRGEDVVLTSVPWIFAAPTGANKVTVYWDEVPGATGYRVRWGTASGVYPNVSSVQSGDARMLSVTGLTSEQEYYFVVEAERNGVWSAPSEEDSAVPHVGAIPWDTGDAASILRAVRSLTGNDYGDISVLSPDGVYYSSIGGVVQSESPAPLQYNTAQGVVETSDGGLLMPLQMEDKGEGISSILQQRDHTGPYRRIRTDSEHPCIGARGNFFLPQWYVFVSGDTHANTRDTPHVYFGIAYDAAGGGRVDIEGGISYHPRGRGVRRNGREEGKDPGSPPPSYARWMPYMRIRIEKPRKQGTDTDKYIPVVGTTRSDLSWDMVQYGYVVDINLRINSEARFREKSAVLEIKAWRYLIDTDPDSPYYQHTFVGVAKVPDFTRGNPRVRRVISMAQNGIPKDDQDGWRRTGSFARYIGVGYVSRITLEELNEVQVFCNGWQQWTPSFGGDVRVFPNEQVVKVEDFLPIEQYFREVVTVDLR